MTDLPYMPLWCAVFLADTTQLDDRASWAYIALCMNYWLNQEPPRDDDRSLARIARQPLSVWRRIRPTVEPFFECDAEGRFVSWRHEKVEELLEEARKKHEGLSLAGKRGAEEKAKRKQQAPPGQAKAGLKQTESESKTERKQAAPPVLPRARFSSAAEYDALVAALRKAATAESDPNPGLDNPAPIIGLLQAGYELELDVLPVIRAKTRGNQRVGSWGYYVSAIKEARAARVGAASAPAPVAEPQEAKWRRWWASWVKHRFWHMEWGPRPDCLGCRIPQELRDKWGAEAAA